MCIYSILHLQFHSISISNPNLIARNETWQIKPKELDHSFKCETEEISPSRIHTSLDLVFQHNLQRLAEKERVKSWRYEKFIQYDENRL